ncbi:hypothetical protein SEA_MINDY_84 [Mycobacterium phage Mindy]|uniref:Uncharacterized protein n=5 Tax=Kostyavirus TaxID=1623284 RepID=G1DI19_9CAUD|nr:hypothetical protein PBI_PHRUX_82 [Mycobacterium phage Phrux]YP_009208491.1 hypothetical protein SEA_TOTO_83 [Mycobacterium phage Toto]YP_009225371.1 hypothetical protein SEA_MINDY_84 [Mycobacterium phage Mindy]YP_654841.1 gp86 [Mycobacterium phage 244]AEK08934.1 hypothetical protein PBI_HENRY_83 [Mycobacterium phage Henry]APU02900.1 hypothetical protein SEA_CRYSTALP_84 [Mycobacterium phage CrystalP]ATN92649.1 hypothetical protein SEA_YASSJOHNNY_82 [Mycobacterium phage YassJohnny]AXH65815
MGKTKRYKKIDKVLNDHFRKAEKTPKGKWWWGANYVLAEAIAAACYHVRVDGVHLFTDEEEAELVKLELLMLAYESDELLTNCTAQESSWLWAEAMYLLGRWLDRLWS